jgi:hypothetical protein
MKPVQLIGPIRQIMKRIWYNDETILIQPADIWNESRMTNEMNLNQLDMKSTQQDAD